MPCNPRFICLAAATLLWWNPGCKSDAPPTTTTTETPETETPDTPDTPEPQGPEAPEGSVVVQVLLDEVPTKDVLVQQGGQAQHTQTDEDGFAVVALDPTISGFPVIVASHPEARIIGVEVPDNYDGDVLSIALKRFNITDNRRYAFQDPGLPDASNTSAQCGHCHVGQNKDWSESVHRTSASNPTVQDLYSGTAHAFTTEETCVAASGRWLQGLEPGTRNPAFRCYIGDGTLPTLNTECGDDAPCDDVATAFGGCADCHAPGINGAIGGRDLLRATDFSYEYGVHCDVCHRVESVDHNATAAGVGGRLKLLRPSEAPSSPSLGQWQPLTFGPRHDVPNPRMGSVARDHYTNGDLCSGCHQLDQEVLVPGQSIDTARWPSGRLPIHSTFEEWKQGPLKDVAVCNSCHMPPDAATGNSVNIERDITLTEGITQGFKRPPGNVRHHRWVGPRLAGNRMLSLAGAVFVTKTVQDGQLTTTVTTRHIGPGHAIPTGEPMRSMVLRVRAFCDGTELTATGGDVVPDYGGYLAVKNSSEDWSQWPGASVGDVIRVVARSGEWVDYEGFGPFGDGTFSAAQKGVPVESFVGERTITAVNGDAVTLDAALPTGTMAYRITRTAVGSAITEAGAPGFGFARVLTGPDGTRMVPHFMAVDVVSDNRLLPKKEWTTTHTFAASCASPTVQATLKYRSYPRHVALERGWTWDETVMAEVVR